MPGKILKRCSLCHGFHASYLEDDPQLGRLHLCYRCWKSRHPSPIEVMPPPPKEARPSTRKKANKRSTG